MGYNQGSITKIWELCQVVRESIEEGLAFLAPGLILSGKFLQLIISAWRSWLDTRVDGRVGQEMCFRKKGVRVWPGLRDL